MKASLLQESEAIVVLTTRSRVVWRTMHSCTWKVIPQQDLIFPFLLSNDLSHCHCVTFISQKAQNGLPTFPALTAPSA